MGAEYAGHSAARRMHARAIDGVSRVCTVLCCNLLYVSRWCRAMRFGAPRVVCGAGDLLSIYM